MARAFLITSIALVHNSKKAYYNVGLALAHLLLISDRHGDDLADFASLAHLDRLLDRNLIEWVHGLLLSLQFYTRACCIDAHFKGVVQATLHTYKSLHFGLSINGQYLIIKF